jgi:hypothetical protein
LKPRVESKKLIFYYFFVFHKGAPKSPLPNLIKPNMTLSETLFDEDEKKKTKSERDLILADKICKENWTFSDKDKILRFCLKNGLSLSTEAVLKITPKLFSEWLKKDLSFQLLISSISCVQSVHLINTFDRNEEFVEQASTKLSEVFRFNLKMLVSSKQWQLAQYWPNLLKYVHKFCKMNLEIPTFA